MQAFTLHMPLLSNPLVGRVKIRNNSLFKSNGKITSSIFRLTVLCVITSLLVAQFLNVQHIGLN